MLKMIFFHVAGFCLLKQETKFYSLDGGSQAWQHRSYWFLPVIQEYVKKGVKKNVLHQFTLLNNIQNISWINNNSFHQSISHHIQITFTNPLDQRFSNHHNIYMSHFVSTQSPFPCSWSGLWDSAFLMDSQVTLTLLVHKTYFQ